MTSRFSWQTQGIWPPCSDGLDVNSLDRSNSKKYLVTADDFSSVKLFKYPVCLKKQIYNKYKGHSSHVTSIKWMYDDRFVVSTGGLEKSVIQCTFEDSPDIIYDY
jgi:microtubule-associated protein-like 6